jgi:hypothetical protein
MAGCWAAGLSAAPCRQQVQVQYDCHATAVLPALCQAVGNSVASSIQAWQPQGALLCSCLHNRVVLCVMPLQHPADCQCLADKLSMLLLPAG